MLNSAYKRTCYSCIWHACRYINTVRRAKLILRTDTLFALQVLGKAPEQPMVWQGCSGSLPLAAASGVNLGNAAGLTCSSNLVKAPDSSSRQQINRSLMHIPHQQQTAATLTPLCSVRRDSAPDSIHACLGNIIASPRTSPAPRGSCSRALGQSSSASPRLFDPNSRTQAQLLQRLPGSSDQQLGIARQDASSRLGLAGCSRGAPSAKPEIKLTFEMYARSEPSCHQLQSFRAT